MINWYSKNTRVSFFSLYYRGNSRLWFHGCRFVLANIKERRKPTKRSISRLNMDNIWNQLKPNEFFISWNCMPWKLVENIKWRWKLKLYSTRYNFFFDKSINYCSFCVLEIAVYETGLSLREKLCTMYITNIYSLCGFTVSIYYLPRASNIRRFDALTHSNFIYFELNSRTTLIYF